MEWDPTVGMSLWRIWQSATYLVISCLLRFLCFVCGEHGGQPWFSGSYAGLRRAKVRRGGFNDFASIGSAQNPASRSGNSLPSNFSCLSFYLENKKLFSTVLSVTASLAQLLLFLMFVTRSMLACAGAFFPYPALFPAFSFIFFTSLF